MSDFTFEKLRQNVLYDICFSDPAKMTEQPLVKQISIKQ
jgi:hypothetical protein